MTSVSQLIRRRRARRSRTRQVGARRRVVAMIGLLLLLLTVVLPVGVGGTLGLGYYAAATADLPDPRATIFQDAAVGPTQMTDRTGQTLIWSIEDPIGDQRAWISLDSVPSVLTAATLLSEDPSFLETPPRSTEASVLRIVENYLFGPLAPDDTLTGRLVRNVLAPPPDQPTAADRSREYALVAELNRRYTRQEILEWHLNTNYYGGDAIGVDAAARIYLGKPATDLTVDEAALLAAIPTAPQYNPADNIDAARGRQADLLRRLQVAGSITQDEYNTAVAQVTPVQANPVGTPQTAPDYALYARNQAEDILNSLGYDGARLVSRGGLRIITALDLNVQAQADCTLANHLTQLAGGVPQSADVCVGVGYMPAVPPALENPPDTGALAVIDTRRGELLAAVGDVRTPTRQPAVTLHPVVYMSGFSSALFTPATMVLDIPTRRFPGAADGLVYTPENPDDTYSGPINLRNAMSAGRLPPVVGVANTQGLDNILRTARLMGMASLDTRTYDLSLLERGGGASVLGATYAYSVFSTLGEMRGVQPGIPARGAPPRQPVAVLQIENASGEVLWSYDTEDEAHVTPILDDGLAYLVNDVLMDSDDEQALNSSRPAAVVSGRAGASGAWTIGYTPTLAVGVWVGRSDDAPMTLDARALNGAGPAWRAVLDYTSDRLTLPREGWPTPPNIVEARVCERSGLRPNDACPQQTEIFLENTQPPQVDTYWRAVSVNTQTNLLATANTPTNFREERRYFVPPPEAADWWAATQPLAAQLPAQYDTLTRPDAISATVITQPGLFDYVSGQVDVRGTLAAESLQYYQLAYGGGLNPTEWVDITRQQTDYDPNASLGSWDTTGLEGLYNLRLTVVLEDNSIDPYIVQVTVDNTPPTITLSAGAPGQRFSFFADETIPLRAEVTDNIAIDRVEFYHNDVFVGTDASFPYGYDHPIVGDGPQAFRAVAVDAAGNQTTATFNVEVERGS